MPTIGSSSSCASGRTLSLDEIALRLSVPVGTVKSRLHYALRMLRTDLEATDGRV
ncbi:MAG: sigma factor-like helix-turn-helix DNA-binding protein [Candidatus Limnocylindrales bacterium]